MHFQWSGDIHHVWREANWYNVRNNWVVMYQSTSVKFDFTPSNTKFTDEDDHHLAGWIAEKIPFDRKGRTGNTIYQAMHELVRDYLLVKSSGY